MTVHLDRFHEMTTKAKRLCASELSLACGEQCRLSLLIISYWSGLSQSRSLNTFIPVIKLGFWSMCTNNTSAQSYLDYFNFSVAKRWLLYVGLLRNHLNRFNCYYGKLYILCVFYVIRNDGPKMNGPNDDNGCVFISPGIACFRCTLSASLWLLT